MLPITLARLRRIRIDPKPWRSGSETVGPPASRQSHQAAILRAATELPGQVDLALGDGERAKFEGVAGEFMQDEA